MPINKSVNAWVDASSGFEFQKHCIIYLFLENYETLKDKKYFVYVEHYDDFLICYYSEDEIINYIESYQAKKSWKDWSIDNDLIEILNKIVETGDALRKDPIKKSPEYDHELHFITNSPIRLRKEKKTCQINSANKEVKFSSLDKVIKDYIKWKVEAELGKGNLKIWELEKIELVFIDFAKWSKDQKDALIWMFTRVFRNKVYDPIASVEVLLSLFRDCETMYNQWHVRSLSDKTKRVESSNIMEAINIIQSKQKAFALWRDRKADIANLLNVPIARRPQFELDFINSFDFFKDIKQVYHQKILYFVDRNRDLFDSETDEVTCIVKLYDRFILIDSQIDDQFKLKAILFAAYIQIIETLWA